MTVEETSDTELLERWINNIKNKNAELFPQAFESTPGLTL